MKDRRVLDKWNWRYEAETPVNCRKINTPHLQLEGERLRLEQQIHPAIEQFNTINIIIRVVTLPI